MYQLLIAAAVLGLASDPSHAAAPWTHCRSEGEDATSHHYYFFVDRGAGIERVRWVWNGGCCNPPKVTDYTLRLPGQPGTIQVRHLTGEREDAPTLVTSANAPLALVREYTLTLSRTGPGAQALTLDAHQATDVYNLLNLLGGERPEQSTEDCQPMGSELQP